MVLLLVRRLGAGASDVSPCRRVRLGSTGAEGLNEEPGGSIGSGGITQPWGAGKVRSGSGRRLSSTPCRLLSCAVPYPLFSLRRERSPARAPHRLPLRRPRPRAPPSAAGRSSRSAPAPTARGATPLPCSAAIQRCPLRIPRPRPTTRSRSGHTRRGSERSRRQSSGWSRMRGSGWGRGRGVDRAATAGASAKIGPAAPFALSGSATRHGGPFPSPAQPKAAARAGERGVPEPGTARRFFLPWAKCR